MDLPRANWSVNKVIFWMSGVWRDELWVSRPDDTNYQLHNRGQVYRPGQRSVFNVNHFSLLKLQQCGVAWTSVLLN